ncbi:hypothetical protein PoB_006969500 [Plakobranchus ocellatus]|uniref:Uncharacterized protein n=1 Tax=Plakobranchus ocellatus TaxID=259542 RepID=A0AAV4DGU7_9GAST|nr:hypothetical protein PoB_006969500 [Plakobranchus ocellatus]
MDRYTQVFVYSKSTINLSHALARAPVAGLEPVTEESLQISGLFNTGDCRLSGPFSSQGVGCEARTRDGRFPAHPQVILPFSQQGHEVWFLPIASPQQGDFRLSGPTSGQDAGSGARTRDRRVTAEGSQGGLANHCVTVARSTK